MNIHKTPLVSIVIPTFNRQNLLLKAVQSALNQTYKNIEIIVIDDASPQDAEPLIKNLGDHRIKYFRNTVNSGPGFSRNRGISEAQGEYINFLDDDDLLDETKIEKQILKFQHSTKDVGVVYCGYRMIYEGEIFLSQFPAFRGNVFNDCLLRVISAPNTFLIKRECLIKIGDFDEKLWAGEDWDLWIRLSKEFSFDFINEILTTFTIHKSSHLSHNLLNFINGRELITKKYFSDLAHRKVILSEHYRHLGGLLVLSRNKAKGRQNLIKSIKANVLNYKTYIFLFLSFGGKIGQSILEDLITLKYKDARMYQ